MTNQATSAVLRNISEAKPQTARDKALLEAFPVVDPENEPQGSRVLVQLKRPKRVSKGGIILDSETVDTDRWNTQIGKVLSLGVLAYRNRDTMVLWPEGKWCDVGDYVRCPKYHGDRFEITPPVDDGLGPVLFVIFRDLDILSKVTGDPLAVKAFI